MSYEGPDWVLAAAGGVFLVTCLYILLFWTPPSQRKPRRPPEDTQ